MDVCLLMGGLNTRVWAGLGSRRAWWLLTWAVRGQKGGLRALGMVQGSQSRPGDRRQGLAALPCSPCFAPAWQRAEVAAHQAADCARLRVWTTQPPATLCRASLVFLWRGRRWSLLLGALGAVCPGLALRLPPHSVLVFPGKQSHGAWCPGVDRAAPQQFRVARVSSGRGVGQARRPPSRGRWGLRGLGRPGHAGPVRSSSWPETAGAWRRNPPSHPVFSLCWGPGPQLPGVGVGPTGRGRGQLEPLGPALAGERSGFPLLSGLGPKSAGREP